MKTTENFGLTIYEPNDVTAYLTASGWNGTMEKIDASMEVIETAGATNATDIATLEQQVSTDHDELNNLTGEVSDLTTTIQGNVANIAGLTTRMSQAEGNIANLQTEVSSVVAHDYVGVLSHGEKRVAIGIGEYTENSLIDIYISRYGLAATGVEVRPATGGQPNLVVLTFDKEQTADVRIDVSVREPNLATAN